MRTYVRSNHEDAGWSSVMAQLSSDDAGTLRGALTVGWYPLSLQYRLLRAIDDTLGTGDGSLVHEVGRFEAEQDLTVVHRLFLRMANPGFVLQQAGRYWDRFYTSGRWEVERESSNSAAVRLVDLDPFDSLMGDYLFAYIIRMWELMGAELVDAKRSVRGSEIFVSGSWR